MPQTADRRRSRILAQIEARGHVAVRDLAEDLAVSEATVRRDLKDLAAQRLLDLVYGGATLRRAPEYSLASKERKNVEAKRSIGKLAAALVQDRDTIFIDSGSTCNQMARHLVVRRSLTVILHSIRLALDLGGAPEAKILHLGGELRPELQDTIGPLTLSAIDQLRGYVAFVGADGLGQEFGVSAADIDSAHLYQHVIRHARETVLLVDHEKFAAPSLYRICGWESIRRVVTDQRPPEPWATFLKERGIQVLWGEQDP